MKTTVPENLRENFGYIEMMLYYLNDKELLRENVAEKVKRYPNHGLYFNIEIRKKAYEALLWLEENPDYDWWELSLHPIPDKEIFKKRMHNLFVILNEFSLYK